MINVLAYILIFILFVVIIFFMLRSLIVGITMLTEVPYLPSNNAYKEAIKYLDIKDGDKVIDIGCGDGRVLRYASKKYPNAQFVGIDTNWLLIAYANILKFFSGRKNIKFINANIHNFDISEFDKIYMFLLPFLVDQILLDKFNQLKKDCVVISFRYPLGKKFFDLNNITKYPVKYRGKTENIFKWVNK